VSLYTFDKNFTVGIEEVPALAFRKTKRNNIVLNRTIERKEPILKSKTRVNFGIIKI
jgi:hypothetical protein